MEITVQIWETLQKIELTNEQEASLWARGAVEVTVGNLMYTIEASDEYNWWYIATPKK
jgi:hypothetical protein